MQPKKCFAKSFQTDSRTLTHTCTQTQMDESWPQWMPCKRRGEATLDILVAAFAVLFGGKMFLYDAPTTKTMWPQQQHQPRTNEPHQNESSQKKTKSKRARAARENLERTYCTCTIKQAMGLGNWCFSIEGRCFSLFGCLRRPPMLLQLQKQQKQSAGFYEWSFWRGI